MEIREVNINWGMMLFISTVILLLFIYPKTGAFYRKLLNFSVLKRLNTYVIIFSALILIFTANLIISHRSLSSTYYLLTRPSSQTIMLDSYELLLLIINMTIATPIIEELIFRAPLSLWSNRLPTFLFSLSISSIIFGLLHTEYPLFGFVLGLTFGSVFRLSNSLLPAILTHMLWNIFSLFYFNYI